MKRAQIIGEVFVYILASVVFVLVLTYGYQAIQGFMQKQEQIYLVDLKTTLETSADRIMLSYGSVEKLDLNLPKQYRQICFTTYKPLAQVQPSQTTYFSPLLQSAWNTGQENVFLVPKQPTPILVKNIVVTPNGVCCIEPQGQFSMRLEGKGNYAEVTTWDSTTWPCQ